jgi:hypothetical protein
MYIDYVAIEDQKISYTLSRASQAFFDVTLITILCINNGGMVTAGPFASVLKWLAVGICSAQLPFNLVNSLLIAPN